MAKVDNKDGGKVAQTSDVNVLPVSHNVNESVCEIESNYRRIFKRIDLVYPENDITYIS